MILYGYVKVEQDIDVLVELDSFVHVSKDTILYGEIHDYDSPVGRVFLSGANSYDKSFRLREASMDFLGDTTRYWKLLSPLEVLAMEAE